MNVIGCWKYHKESNIFLIPVLFVHPETKKSVRVTCLFDTGFSGYFGLDGDSINTLQLAKSGDAYALSAGGTVLFENYSGTAQILTADEKIIGTISNQERELIKSDLLVIPIQKFHVPIMGMKAIKLYHWLLLPDKEMLLMVN